MKICPSTSEGVANSSWEELPGNLVAAQDHSQKYFLEKP